MRKISWQIKLISMLNYERRTRNKRSEKGKETKQRQWTYIHVLQYKQLWNLLFLPFATQSPPHIASEERNKTSHIHIIIHTYCESKIERMSIGFYRACQVSTIALWPGSLMCHICSKSVSILSLSLPLRTPFIFLCF